MKKQKRLQKLMIFNIIVWGLVLVSTCLHYQFNPFSFVWFEVIAPVGHFFSIVFSAISGFSISMYELFKPETFWGWVWFIIFVVPIICLPIYVVLLVLFAGKLSHHETVVPPSYLK